jgi:hypothetical protein
VRLLPSNKFTQKQLESTPNWWYRLGAISSAIKDPQAPDASFLLVILCYVLREAFDADANDRG